MKVNRTLNHEIRTIINDLSICIHSDTYVHQKNENVKESKYTTGDRYYDNALCQ